MGKGVSLSSTRVGQSSIARGQHILTSPNQNQVCPLSRWDGYFIRASRLCVHSSPTEIIPSCLRVFSFHSSPSSEPPISSLSFHPYFFRNIYSITQGLMVVTHSGNMLLTASCRYVWQKNTVGFSGIEGRKEVSCLNRYDLKVGIWLGSCLILSAAEWLNQRLFPVPFEISFVSVMIPLKNTIEILFNWRKRKTF